MSSGTDENVVLDSLEFFSRLYCAAEGQEEKTRIINALGTYEPREQDAGFIEEIFFTYLQETDRILSHRFSKCIYTRFSSELLPLLLQSIKHDKDNNVLINCVMCLMKYPGNEGHERIDELFDEVDDPDFQFFSACYIWKYNPLHVISRLKKLVEGTETEKITVSKICVALANKRLLGLVNYLLEDDSANVRAKARVAYNKIELTVDVPKSELFFADHLSENYVQKFKNIISSSCDLQSKIAVMNILDNLNQSDLLDTVSAELENENNPFLIATYVKHLGKFGKLQYQQSIMKFLEHDDQRVVANCIEGLTYCDYDPELIPMFKRFLNSRDHRISFNSVLGLWKAGEKEIVIDHIKSGVKSKKVWKRNSVLYSIEKINEPVLRPYLEILSKDGKKQIRNKARVLLKEIEESGKEVCPETRKTAEETEDNISFLLRTGKVPENYVQERIATVKSKEVKLNDKLDAIRELSFFATDEHYTRLFKLFLGASDVNLKAALTETIGKTFSGGKEFLLDQLKEAKDPRIITSALETISYYDYQPDIPDLLPFLYHEIQPVVIAASRLLFDVIPEEMMEKISSMLVSANPDIRKSALHALSIRKTYESYIAVRKLLNDNNLDIAITASEIVSDFEKNSDFKMRLAEELKSRQLEAYHTDVSGMKDDLFKKIEGITWAEMTRDSFEKLVSPLLDGTNIKQFAQYVIESKIKELQAYSTGLMCRYLELLSEESTDFLSRMLDSENSFLIAHTLKGLINCSKPVFFEKLARLLQCNEFDIQVETLSVLLQSRVYKEKLIASSEILEPGTENLIDIINNAVSGTGYKPADFEKIHAKNNELVLLLDEKQRRIETDQDLIRQKEGYIVDLERKIQIIDEKLRLQHHTVNTLKQQLEKKDSEVDLGCLNEQLQSNAAEIDGLKADIAERDSKIRELSEKCRELESSHAGARENSNGEGESRMRQALQEAVEKSVLSGKEIQKLMSEIESLRNVRKNLSEEIDMLRDENAVYQKKIGKLEEEILRFDMELSKAKDRPQVSGDIPASRPPVSRTASGSGLHEEAKRKMPSKPQPVKDPATHKESHAGKDQEEKKSGTAVTPSEDHRKHLKMVPLIILFFLVLYQFLPTTVTETGKITMIETPPVAQPDQADSKGNHQKSVITLENVVENWDKIDRSVSDREKKRDRLYKMIENLEILYSRGEFYTVKVKLLSEEEINARVTLLEIIDNIKRKMVLWDYAEGTWITSEEMVKRTIVVKNRSQ